MADELNLLISVVMDLQERVKFLERGIAKTPRPMVNDEPIDVPVRVSQSDELPIGAIRASLTRSQQDAIVELFRAKVPVMAIARKMNCSDQTIYNQLRKAGIIGPPQRKGLPVTPTEETHVEEIEEAHKEDTEETAYV